MTLHRGTHMGARGSSETLRFWKLTEGEAKPSESRTDPVTSYQAFWKADAHLHAGTYSPQKWAEPGPRWLSQNLYLSGQRSKTRLSIERKGLRPSAIPFWDTMPRRVPDGTPIRVISGVPPPLPSEARDRAAPRRPSS